MGGKPVPNTLGRGLTPNRIGKRGESALQQAIKETALVSGSGCGGQKGDVKQGQSKKNPYRFKRMLEKKSVVGKSIKLQKAWLEKGVNQALRMGQEFALVLGFETMKVPAPDQWAVIPLKRLEELYDIEKQFYDLKNQEEQG